jgi:ABC-type cobalamin/Fe3+-siderophores transport system ATPase subunit
VGPARLPELRRILLMGKKISCVFPGCGKSTLLKLLAGTLQQGKKKQGSILFNGKDPRDGNYKRSISFVPQADTHIGIQLVAAVPLPQ